MPAPRNATEMSTGERESAQEVVSDDLLLRIYRVGAMTRAVDERLWILSRQGRVSFVITPRGHEVAQIASAATVRPGKDWLWLYYRDLAVGLAMGISPYEVFLGAMGRGDDPHSGGRQLSMHFSSPDLRIGTVSSAIAAHIPHAVGSAYAMNVLGEDSISYCWFGEGATSEGAFHVSLNFAGIHRLPVIFICENNGYAISVPAALQLPTESVAERAGAYNLAGASVDGTDAVAVYRACVEAVERARSGAGPSLLELRVPRTTPHSSQDDDAYRTEEQRRQAAEADPLPRLRAQLLEHGAISEEQDRQLIDRIHQEVAAAAERAWNADVPPADRAARWLYDGDPPQVRLDPAIGRWHGVFPDDED